MGEGWGRESNDLEQGNPKNNEVFAQAIKENKTITEFWLDNNDLGHGNAKNIEGLAQAIKREQKITYLELNSNNLRQGNPKNIEVLVQAIKENKTITYLQKHLSPSYKREQNNFLLSSTYYGLQDDNPFKKLQKIVYAR